jgi:hypothetical protein
VTVIAGSVGADAGSVGADVGAVQADEGSLEGDNSELRSDLGQLRQDFVSLQAASQTVPTYIPAGGMPAGSTVAAAVAAAKTEVALSGHDETSATTTASEILKEADALSTEATRIAAPAKCD